MILTNSDFLMTPFSPIVSSYPWEVKGQAILSPKGQAKDCVTDESLDKLFDSPKGPFTRFKGGSISSLIPMKCLNQPINTLQGAKRIKVCKEDAYSHSHYNKKHIKETHIDAKDSQREGLTKCRKCISEHQETIEPKKTKILVTQKI